MAIKLFTQFKIEHPIANLEFHPCVVVGADDEGEVIVETCEEIDAQFYAVYVRYNSVVNDDEHLGLECIADCDTKQEALELYDFLSNLLLKYTPE